MRKLQALTISLLFLITNNIQASLFQAPNPYSFGPEGRTVSDLRDFATPKQMVSILPNRPVVATDSEGNRLYYTSDGKMSLSIAKDGSMSFSIGGVTKSRNSDGDITGITRTIQGSGLLQEIKNDDNQVIGYRALNGDGKVAATYDKDKNLTATYVYTGQGAKLDYVKNEMTGGKTLYDKYQRAMADVDFDGYVLATYQYQDVSYEYGADGKSVDTIDNKAGSNEGLLVSKKTYELNMKEEIEYSTTYFDLEGKITHITNNEGLIVTEYHYKNDDGANKILDYVLDNLTKNKTYYDKHGKADYTVNDKDTVITRYYDNYTVNIAADGSYSQVTKYDIDGTELYTTLKNTSYNSDGTIDKVMDKDDVVLEQYYYKMDADDNKVIDYVVNFFDVDYNSKTYTWYEEDKPKYVTSTSERPSDDLSSNILKDFSWNGNTLVYTFDRKTETTKWYNMDKDLVYETMNERIITKNLYNNGQLVGKWDAQEKKLTIFINERSWLTIKADEEPSVSSISNIIANS